jgi:sialidase-1
VLLGTWNRGDDKEVDIAHRTSRDTRRVFVAYSDDDGATWHDRKEITSSVKLPDWGWYATGPCHGIQLSTGRLVIPANHTARGGDHKRSHSHIIFSDDGGDSWKLGGSADAATNESTVAELSTGALMLNMRSYAKKNRRAVATSTDGGLTWSKVKLAPELIEPVCQGSLLRVPLNGKPAFIFSNPASKKRENLTLRLSTDDCATWSDGYLLQSGFSADSDLCPLPGGQVGGLYERDGDG